MTELTPSPALTENIARNRRRWLIGAMAGVAALGGVGLAWRTYPPQSILPTAESGLWQLEFAGLGGGTFSMASLRGQPVLLNFWATWCPPCIEELPLLSRFYREHSTKGWQVLGLAVDQMEPVKQFLAKSPVTFPVALAGVSGVELGRSLGNLSGGLPFTVVLGSDGLIAHRKIGKVSPENLLAWASLK
ncbi:redoxin family protein [Rhodoferax sp.]|uniref:TlpA disulfide reductase family protein n=1 Tax=Rhodoferax sp. TaxID=50421 RepID=UPI00374CCBCC